MNKESLRSFRTPRESELGLLRIKNAAGLEIAALPNGCLFAIEHDDGHGRTMLNQTLGSPLGGSMARILLRTEAWTAEAVGPGAVVRFGAGSDQFVWLGATRGLHHRVTLWPHPTRNLSGHGAWNCATPPRPRFPAMRSSSRIWGSASAIS